MRTFVIFVLFLACRIASAQTAAELIAQGDALDAQLKTPEALGIYLKVEAITPDDPRLHIKIAKQYGESMVDATSATEKRALGEEALAHAKMAVALAPELGDAHLALAICYGRLMDLMGVRTKVEYSRLVKTHGDQAVALDPKSDYAWHMLGRWHQAVCTTNKLLLGTVKVVYGGLPESSLEKAAECFAAAAALAPQRVAHWIELGSYLRVSGKVQGSPGSDRARGLALPNTERDDPDTKARGEASLKTLPRK